MASEETLIEVRKQKHQELNGGTYPLYNPKDMDCTIGHYLKHVSWEDIPVSLDPNVLGMRSALRGRISFIRKSGGITFIKLTDQTGSIQLIFSRAVLSDYDRLNLLDLGDIFHVNGQACMSKTGEKSMLVGTWEVLTKAHRPPPEKFAGVTDSELKHRKRYLDLMSSEETRARFIVRTYVLRAIRAFMDSNDFLEVETPTLSTISSGANAKPFTTHHNALDTSLNLRIAPELNLKRLLVGGLDRVYEIGRSYRNEGIDARHNPEFTMIESYQAYGNFPELIVMTKDLLRSVDSYLKENLPPFALPYYKQWRAERHYSLSQFVEVTMISAVLTGLSKAEIDFEIGAQWGRTPSGESPAFTEIQVRNPTNERLQKIDMKGLFHALSNVNSIGEQIAVLFEYVAEPFLIEDYRSGDGLHSCPVFITEYPKEISPLARGNDQRPDIADRFELFVEGRELANAFQELNDPEEQAVRFQDQLDSNQKDAMAFDADYIEALEHGMPPAIGFGMGIDRLVMLITNTSSIKDVILFPTLRPEK